MPAKHTPKRKHQRPIPPRYPVVAMLRPAVYRRILAAAKLEHVSVSRFVSELLEYVYPSTH